MSDTTLRLVEARAYLSEAYAEADRLKEERDAAEMSDGIEKAERAYVEAGLIEAMELLRRFRKPYADRTVMRDSGAFLAARGGGHG